MSLFHTSLRSLRASSAAMPSLPARSSASATLASGRRMLSTDKDGAAAQPGSAVAKAPSDKAVLEADILSGVPYEVSSRSVRIYQPAKTATQSGRAETNYWRLDFDVKDRWENPLMGWASSADTVQALRIRFDSKQAAINFAERQGYDFWVDEPKEGKFRVKNYSENFKYSPTKLRIARTK